VGYRRCWRVLIFSTILTICFSSFTTSIQIKAIAQGKPHYPAYFTKDALRGRVYLFSPFRYKHYSYFCGAKNSRKNTLLKHKEMKYWKKLTHPELQSRIEKALEENVDFEKDTSLG
jgi:hypothetical protein